MSESKSNRFADPVVWLVVLLFGVFLYVFAYPAVLALLYPAAYKVEGLDKALRASALPLTWLVQAVPAYQTYVEFLQDLLHFR